jgi:hypothetical protein
MRAPLFCETQDDALTKNARKRLPDSITLNLRYASNITPNTPVGLGVFLRRTGR